MFGVGVGIRVGGRTAFGGGFDADYQAVLNYATTQGYTLPSAGQQTLQNQLIVDLKAAGVWSKLDTFANFATDGSSSFALIDWKRLTQYTAINSPTFTTNQGFTGNGVSSWINSNYNPSTSGNLIQASNANITIYMNTINDTLLKFFYGAIDTYAIQLAEDNTPNTMRPDVFGNNSGVPSIAKIGAKWFSSNRVNSSEITLIQNTTSTTSTYTFRGIPNVNVAILARVDNLGAIAVPTNRQVSVFSGGQSLVSENNAYRTAWLNYFNSL